jgi:hypothetical protein
VAAAITAVTRHAEELPRGQWTIEIPRFPVYGVRHLRCGHCRADLVGVRLFRSPLCSDNCRRLWRNAQQQTERRRYPSVKAKVNKSRDARRAEAREGRTCEHCGRAIEALRSTKRYCSAVCRVRHHRDAR